MKNKEKLYSIALVSAALALFFIIISSTASAASSPTVVETRITNNGTALNSAIYGNTIVWQDNRNRTWHIYMYDILAQKETQITTNPVNQIIAAQINPDIYLNNVVWEDHCFRNSDIYMKNLITKNQTRITTSGKASYPKIYGRRIVWLDKRNVSSEGDIYMYDLTTKRETKISNSGSASAPDIYGDRIVWVDKNQYGEPALALYDLSTNKVTILGYEFLRAAAIYGDKIVIQTDPDNIAMYDLSTYTGITIVPHDTEYDLDIYDNKVVYTWTDRLTENEIWMYNISTSMETRISTSETASNPKVFGNRIVWRDWRNGGSDIYLGTLIYPPVAAFPASPIFGRDSAANSEIY